jgi:hypothetical protein
MFQLAFTKATDQTSHLFPVGGKISDMHLEQWINIKSCVKIGINASEMLVLLTLAYRA